MRACPVCNIKNITYTNVESFKKAVKMGTMCPSCRTSKNNKSNKRNVSKENNPSWKGFNLIPGKVFSRLKRGAVQRGLTFNLTIEDIWNKCIDQDFKCRFTGLELIWDENASIDRIDSSLGYNPSNIQIVDKRINMLKRDLLDEDFIALCKLVAKNAI